MVANGADVNAKGLDGATPLHDAVSNGTDSYVVYLIKHGADPKIRNDHDKSPIDIASSTMKSLIEKCQQLTGSESADRKSSKDDKMEVDDVNNVNEKPLEKQQIPCSKDWQDGLKALLPNVVLGGYDANLPQGRGRPKLAAEKEVQSITETEPEDTLESDHDELNDSSNSVLATPLDNSIDEPEPEVLDKDEDPKKVCEEPEVEQRPSQTIEEIPSNNPPAAVAAPKILISETSPSVSFIITLFNIFKNWMF